MATRNINTFIEHLMNEAMTAAGTAGGGKGGKGGKGGDGNDGQGFDFPQYNNPDYGPRPGTLPPPPYNEYTPGFVGPPSWLAPKQPIYLPKDPNEFRPPVIKPRRPGGFRPPMIKPNRPYGPNLFPGKAPRRDPSKPPLPPLGGGY